MLSCDRTKLAQFFSNNLDIDEKLDFLFHLDDCTECWEEVYNVVRARHPHYYKNTSRRLKISKKDLEGNHKNEEAFEVA